MANDYELKEVFDINKFTAVGTPAISDDGIFTSTSVNASNYVYFSNFTATNDLKIEFEFTLSGGYYEGYMLNASQYTDSGLYIGEFAGFVYVDLNIGETGGYGYMQIGHTYKAYVYWKSDNTAEVGILKDTESSYRVGTGTWSGSLPTTFSLGGRYSNNGNAIIDLKKIKIYSNGEEVFKGTKTVVAKIPPAIVSGGSGDTMDYPVALEDIQNYYANLLIIQYHNKPKAIALIKNLVKHLFADMVLFKIRDGFNILREPFAQGKQLDCIGEWIGVDRIYDAGQPLYPWFSLINAEQTTEDAYQGGFQDWNDTIAQDGGFLGFDDLVMGGNQTKLEDDLFLALIKLKIIKNSSIHTMGDIDRMLYQYFGTGIYVTWSGMEMTFNYTNQYNAIIEVAKAKNAIPCPNGMIVKFNPL